MSTNSSMRLLVGLLSTACLIAIGCGRSSGLAVYPVEGVVTLQGEPLEGAIVIFLPEKEGRVASGRTLADGTFQLATSGADRSGAMAGEYRVTIEKEIDVDAQGKPIDYGAGDAGPSSAPQVRGKTISLVPKRYNSVDSSGLAATVIQGSNTVQFDLTK